MDQIREGRTVGQVLGGMPATTGAAALGLLVLAIGSVGPWATLLAISFAGTRGDGKITLGLAVIAALLLATRRRGALLLAVVAMVGAAGASGYDLVHIERVAHHVTFLSARVASAGWGIYAALLGAVVAFLALAVEYVRA